MNIQSLRRLVHSLFCASAATLRRLEAALERPWLLDGVMMLGLFAAIAFAFREVLPTNVRLWIKRLQLDLKKLLFV